MRCWRWRAGLWARVIWGGRDMSDADDPRLASYDDVIEDYISRFGDDARKETLWFGPRCKTLSESIGRACLSELPAGRGKTLKRHSHQNRIPRAVLAEAKAALLSIELDLAGVSSFEDLYNTVDNAILAIPGVGPLLVYDVAQRIAGFLNFEPAEVYLHTGTSLGARALGLDVRRKCIPVREFPKPLQSLNAAQIEDVLCIYRGVLARLHSGQKSRSHGRIRGC